MKATEPLAGNETIGWSTLQKIAFRFFFIFISLNTWFGYNVLKNIFYPRYGKWAMLISFFGKPLYWLDRHFYHIGSSSAQYGKIALNDKPGGWVLLITILWMSVTVCVAWSIIDRKRKNYSRLNYWFKTYMAYYLFLTMDFYAIYKMMCVQMPFPNADALLEPLGHKTRAILLFNFLGVSHGYSIFTGICELLASLLILIRRTRVLGCLVMTAILINIVCLNLFYNIPVKLLSLQLLLITLYLLIPYISKLVKFFYWLQPISLSEKQYTFSTPWKNYAIIALLLIPAWVTYYLILRSTELQKTDKRRQQQKLYDVVSFVTGADALPPLQTDTFRVKRLLFTAYYAHKYASVYSVGDSVSSYEYTWDRKKKIIILTGIREGTQKGEFHYRELSNKQLELNGRWKGQNVSIRLKEIAVDSMPVVKEKMNWVQRN